MCFKLLGWVWLGSERGLRKDQTCHIYLAPFPNKDSVTASLGCNRVSNGKTHRCMAKVMYHAKSHGIWVLPYNGLSHGSMVKPMDIMKRYIHGFCHGTLLHGFCHALFKRKVTNCVFTQPGICFGIAAYWCQMLHCLQTPDFHFGMEI